MSLLFSNIDPTFSPVSHTCLVLVVFITTVLIFSPTNDVCDVFAKKVKNEVVVVVKTPVPLSELLRTVDEHSDFEDEIVSITR